MKYIIFCTSLTLSCIACTRLGLLVSHDINCCATVADTFPTWFASALWYFHYIRMIRNREIWVNSTRVRARGPLVIGGAAPWILRDCVMTEQHIYIIYELRPPRTTRQDSCYWWKYELAECFRREHLKPRWLWCNARTVMKRWLNESTVVSRECTLCARCIYNVQVDHIRS